MPATAPRPVILLVEDNPSMRSLMRSLVERVGSAVYEVADGESAVAMYDRIRPDWVLMDIRMGGMDGLAATRAIRHSDPQARVIIVTEQRGEHVQRAATAAGATGFVLKDDLSVLPGMLAERRAGEHGAEDSAP